MTSPSLQHTGQIGGEEEDSGGYPRDILIARIVVLEPRQKSALRSSLGRTASFCPGMFPPLYQTSSNKFR